MRELPQPIREPIGDTAAEVLITHVGIDTDGLPRVRITVTRGDVRLATDVLRLDRDADRRRLIRAVRKEEKSYQAEPTSTDSAQETGPGSPDVASYSPGGAGGADAAEDASIPADAPLAPLNPFEIERALLRAAASLRAVGQPPESQRGTRHVSADTGAEVYECAAGEAESNARPDIIVRNDLAEFADEAEQLLLVNPDHGIYKRSRMLVRVGREEAPQVRGLARPTEAPVIEMVSLAYLRDRLARVARWYVADEDGTRPALPPKWVAETLLARGDWPFPRLAGIVETPTLRPDGTILDVPGHDPATAFLCVPNEAYPPVPNEPSPDDLVAAVQTILEPFSEFPFVAESDRSTTLAAVLTLVGRTAIDGPTPLFALRASAPGIGKGFLATAISLIGTGRSPALLTVSTEDEEVRKRLLTIGMEGTRCVLLDNVEGALGSPVLAAALTAREVTDRILGTNRLLTVPLDAVWLVTGNNIVYRGDLGRRVLPIDQHAKVEFPEDRVFRRSDLLAWVRQQRPQLVVAALTLLRGFFVAGCPGHGLPRVGSFEGWDAVVRAALVWLGFEDPCAGRERIRAASDADLETLGSLLETWWEVFGSEPQTLARAIESAFGTGGDETLAAALAGLDPKSDGRRPRARTVGDRFRRWKGRITRGMALDLDERKEHGAALWRVARVEDPSGS